ncbi:uncharacterized protein LOC127881296 isoform X2 [Dreissena polymorpha]|uniref:uncharacterized protein LOC127881296 isoform X2 n=1 Tax=Dreissena polymorpha TaxID=45954 RepID=UPI002264CF9B|nr:uncharacterized protein LOC127881296 isoform X2 [Dreissena polymorpha]
MLIAYSDAYSQLRPRNVCRKERRPGARERHSTQRLRWSDDRQGKTQPATPSAHPAEPYAPSYSHESAIRDFAQVQTQRELKPEIAAEVTSQYREPSTIEDIRRSMQRTARVQSALPQRVPAWMLDLDINLDISTADVMPPFDDDEANLKSRASDTFSQRASWTFLDNESDDDTKSVDNIAVPVLSKKSSIKTGDFVTIKASRVGEYSEHIDTTSWPNKNEGKRPMSNTFRIAKPFVTSKTDISESPRRYQGDKKVMSMQQGGIRSTPMQPKSKKYINQMITFHHMRHHDKKIRVAKGTYDKCVYSLERPLTPECPPRSSLRLSGNV